MRTKALLALTIGIVVFTALFVSSVSAQTVSVAATNLTLSASGTGPAPRQSVTFTATLTSGTKPLSAKPVTIYYYDNGVRTDDVTANTNAHGQITETTSFASAGQLNYYASFAGDSYYAAATSSVVTINVG